ncbi:hypothetical protein BH20ACT16_BH20ACT16_09620 [soil metagenome]
MRPIRSLVLLLITYLMLAAAVPATSAAKGIAGADVCGADGCHAVDPAFFHAVMTDGAPLGAPVAAAPFVTVQVHHHRIPGQPARTDRFTYLPSLGLVRPQDATRWIRLYPMRRGELDKLVAPIAPLPANELTAVVHPATDTATQSTSWLPVLAGAAAALALLALLARYATSALKARPRASKSAN